MEDVLFDFLNGGPLNALAMIFIIMGLVQFIKKFGLEGEILTAVSAVIGVVLGVGYQLTQGIPTDFAGWFSAIMIGIVFGLVASGIYDLVGVFARKTSGMDLIETITLETLERDHGNELGSLEG